MYRTVFNIFFLISLILLSVEVKAQGVDTTFVDAQTTVNESISNDFCIGNIVIEGNKNTKDQIIQRELLFNVGDSIKATEWYAIRKQSSENLFNTSLFNSILIRVLEEGGGKRDVKITLVERWYIWPVPVFEIDERNFNQWWETKDLSRASAGVFVTHNNFRGRREELKLLLMGGYNQKLGISYSAPYVNKKKTFGLGFQSIYTLRHEVNHKTEFDKQQYVKLSDSPIQRDILGSIHATYRPNYFFTGLLQLRYRQYMFADTLIVSNPNYSPGGREDLQYFGAFMKLKYDRRDYRSYPLAGYYADVEVQKYGMGVFDNGLDIWTFHTTLRKYWTLSPRWFYAIGFVGKLSANNSPQPYMFNQSLGYGREYVRGYQYYVVDGNAFALAKMNIKFAIVPPNKVKLNFVKTDKFNTIPYAFYLNAFIDGAYVDSPIKNTSNKLPNSYIFGSGIGIDFVTYYDAVARFEFGVNNKGETGFFLSFIAPI